MKEIIFFLSKCWGKLNTSGSSSETGANREQIIDTKWLVVSSSITHWNDWADVQRWRGALPSAVGSSGSAPWESSSWTQTAWPPIQASWRAVFPPGSAFTSAPRNSSSSTHPVCPLLAARRNAEVCFTLELSVHMPDRGTERLSCIAFMQDYETEVLNYLGSNIPISGVHTISSCTVSIRALTIAGSFSTAYTPFISPHMKVLWTAVSLHRTCDGGARTSWRRCCLGGGLGARGSGALVMDLLWANARLASSHSWNSCSSLRERSEDEVNGNVSFDMTP